MPPSEPAGDNWQEASALFEGHRPKAILGQTPRSSSRGVGLVALLVARWGRVESVPGGCWRDAVSPPRKHDTPETPTVEGFGRVLAASDGSNAERGGFEPG